MKKQNNSSDFIQVASPPKTTTSRKRLKIGRIILVILVLSLLAVVIVVGGKFWTIYQDIKALNGDFDQIKNMKDTLPILNFIEEVGPSITKSRLDAAQLKSDVEPWLWLTKALGPIPQYGYDISVAGPLLDLSTALSTAADVTFQGASPLLISLQNKESNSNLTKITDLFLEIQPNLIEASKDLDDAVSARAKIDVLRMSPYFRDLITNKVDPFINLFKEGLPIAFTLPQLTGAESFGPQNYLLLIQNEDELRATGGFITAIGTLVIKDGALISSNIEDSYAFDDLTKPYPLAPWQLNNYMNSQILMLRDSNWYPDFPTSAAMAKYLYAYTRPQPVSGVIAIDQNAVKIILGAIGAVNVEGYSEPITSENMISFIRESKDVALLEGNAQRRKDSLAQLADAIMTKIRTRTDISWISFAQKIVEALNSRHILLSFDNPVIENHLSNLGWDGSLSAGIGDFIMAVDSNIGFTKTNALLDVKYDYSIDLSNINSPTAELTITHKDNASKDVPCIQWGLKSNGTYESLMNRCYWDYLRVYTLDNTQLLLSTPHAIPAEWMIKKESVPAKIDQLIEKIQGIQGFGTLLVVRGGQSLETSFIFSLPQRVIDRSQDDKLITYHLKFQKQAGTVAIPLNLQIHLPVGAEIINTPTGNQIGGDWYLNTNLKQDVKIDVTFKTP